MRRRAVGRDVPELVDEGGKWSTVALCGGDVTAGKRDVPPSGTASARRAAEEVGAVFLGTYSPRLDEKGRLFLPAKFRDELAEGLVITKGQERCLYVFAATEFAGITGRLRDAPLTARTARDYSRVFFASAHDEVPDKQGRVTVPLAL